jgi:hypothetical protein
MTLYFALWMIFWVVLMFRTIGRTSAQQMHEEGQRLHVQETHTKEGG